MTRSAPLTALAWASALTIMFGAATLAGRAAPIQPGTLAASASRDPDLARCRAAGEEALDDPVCRQAWDGARARFFGHAQEAGS